MTRINLLPPEIKEKAERPRILPWIILMSIITIGIIIALFLLFNAQKSGKEKTLQQKEQELETLQKEVKPIEKYEAQQKDLNSMKQLYDKANSGRVPWAQMLNDLAMYTPEGLATASNPKAPAIWLTRLIIDAQPLESAAGAGTQAGAQAGGQAKGGGEGGIETAPITMEGFAAPAWLCIQTWLPRASDFKAKGFLDAYPYYYYFRGHPKVAEFFVRLQNMEEWTNLWIADSKAEVIQEGRLVPDPANPGQLTTEAYSDWVIRFVIKGQWNPEKAIWQGTAKQSTSSGGS